MESQGKESFRYEKRQNMNRKHISHKSWTDWDHVDKLSEKDIDFSDNPEVTSEMFAKAVLRKRLKSVIHQSSLLYSSEFLFKT